MGDEHSTYATLTLVCLPHQTGQGVLRVIFAIEPVMRPLGHLGRVLTTASLV